MKKMGKSSASHCCGPKPSAHSKVSTTKSNTPHHKLMAMGKGHGSMKASAKA